MVVVRRLALTAALGSALAACSLLTDPSGGRFNSPAPRFAAYYDNVTVDFP